MTVPIALYATPPSSVCSHATFDFELSSRSSSSAASTPSTSQKPAVGGLSCLFSSSTVKHASSCSSFSGGGGEELGSMWPDRGEELKELSSSFRYSQSKFNGASMNNRDQSPISVFQGPVSSSSSGVSSSARSPPMRIARERCSNGDVSLNSMRCGSNGLFNGFVRGALGSTCVDYDSPSFEVGNDAAAVLDELTFNMEDGFGDGNFEPYARELLMGAQMRHKIFYEDFVIKAFCEAEKAHRGQVILD